MGTDGRPRRTLETVDVVEIEITGIGTLRNRFVKETAGKPQCMNRIGFPRNFVDPTAGKITMEL